MPHDTRAAVLLPVIAGLNPLICVTHIAAGSNKESN
jgi:hypothetical protein